MVKLEIFTDGASRGNPGRSASGYSVYRDGKLLREDVWYNGLVTNNHAEYAAVIGALKWCGQNFSAKDVEVLVFSDSQLIVNQAKGAYKVKSEGLKPLSLELSALEKGFASVEFRSVPRSNGLISRVDKMLNRFLDGMDEAPK